MDKLIKAFMPVTLFIMVTVCVGAGPVPAHDASTTVCNTDAEKSCKVTIKYQNGDAEAEKQV